MTWRLRVTHSTGYTYDTEVVASYNEARLTPIRVPRQFILDTSIDIYPPARQNRYTDYWGSQVTSFDIHVPHSALEVTATSVIDTRDAAPAPTTGMTWERLADEKVTDPNVEFLAPTPLTTLARELTEPAVEEVIGMSLPDAVVALGGIVHEHVTYTPGSTGVKTSAAQAWELGEGVCQDIAHSTLSLLRAAGIPGRYVSGYFASKDDADVGEVVLGESHAWVEAWIGGWWGWDPTNGIGIGERHVVVARGRDYGDVPPLKGVMAGGASQALGVTVEVTRLA